MRLVFLPLMLMVMVMVMLLASCRRHYTQESAVGVFVERSYMAENPLDWEGGNTSARYDEICNGATQECFSHGFMGGPRWANELVIAPYYSRSKAIIAICTNNANRIKKKGMELRLFFTADGREIECDNCNKHQISRGEPAIGYWNADSELILTTSRAEHAEKRDSVWLIKVQGETYTMRLLKEITSSANARFHGSARLSADGHSLAWIVCDPDCLLVQSDLISGQEKTMSAQCPSNAYSRIEWVGNEAEPKCD